MAVPQQCGAQIDGLISLPTLPVDGGHRTRLTTLPGGFFVFLGMT